MAPRSKAGRKPLSPWFMFRRVLNTVQDGGAEVDLELDFQLGQAQAIEIATSWLGLGEWNVTSGPAALVSTSLAWSLHRRTGTLTDEITPTQSAEFTQAEVLQDMLLVVAQSQTAAAGGGGFSQITGQPVINWVDALGEPLLVAANLTLRLTVGAAVTGAVTFNGAYSKLLYRYVQVSDTELARAFLARQ